MFIGTLLGKQILITSCYISEEKDEVDLSMVGIGKCYDDWAVK